VVSRKTIFQIGFSRCGTTSLYRLFARNGVPSVHWDEGKIARNFIKRKQAGEDPFLDYPGVVFFSDMGDPRTGRLIEPYKEFAYIFEYYSHSYYILNTRNVQNWMLSRCNSSHLIEWHQQALGISTMEGLLLYWAQDWHDHHKKVREFFANKPGKLLVFDIEKDDPQKIADFVKADFAIDPGHYSGSNETDATRRRFHQLPPYLLPKVL
jgi:hypothetical protein